MEDPDMQKYCEQMDYIKRRTLVIDFFMTGSGHAIFKPTTIESMCLQIRKILELIAMSSLIANKTAYSSAYENFSQHWNAELILSDLERINPNFYPTPLIEVPSTIPGVKMNHKKRENDYLDRDFFVKIYKKCGAIMHADNPFGSKVDYGYYERSIPEWRQRIINLLNCHEMRLLNAKDMYLIHMKEEQDDKVHYYYFRPVTP